MVKGHEEKVSLWLRENCKCKKEKQRLASCSGIKAAYHGVTMLRVTNERFCDRCAIQAICAIFVNTDYHCLRQLVSIITVNLDNITSPEQVKLAFLGSLISQISKYMVLPIYKSGWL